MHLSVVSGSEGGSEEREERERNKNKKVSFFSPFAFLRPVLSSKKSARNKRSTIRSPRLDRRGRLRRVVLREQVEGPPRGGSKDPRICGRAAAALAHRKVRDGDQRSVGALDDHLVRDVELRRVGRVGGGVAGRGRGGGRRGRVQLGAQQGRERRRVGEPRCLVGQEPRDRGGEGLGRGRGLDLEGEESRGLETVFAAEVENKRVEEVEVEREGVKSGFL